MKKILIILSLILPLAACTGTSKKSEVNEALTKAITECKQYEGATVLELGSATNLLKGIVGLAGGNDEETKKALNAIKDVDELTVLTFEDCSEEDKKIITDKLESILDKVEVLMEASDNGEQVRIYGTSKKGTTLVNDVIVYVPKECTVVCMFGSISLEDLTQMINV